MYHGKYYYNFKNLQIGFTDWIEPCVDLLVYTHVDVHTQLINLSIVSSNLQGRNARRGLNRKITVTSSVFNFSTWFLAQIVENRETRLSSPFLGPGDKFSKSYDENQIRSERPLAKPRARNLMHDRGTWARQGLSRGAPRGGAPDLVFVITFREIVPRT
jgi:hypothetical protein